ncbi:MAG: winged helix-turn-helix domain-containing protein [Streptosporangiaceae bacterium]
MSSTRQANHHRVQDAGDSPGQPRNRVFERHSIEAGQITHRLPAERDLARELGIAYQTLRHAMKVLRDRGLIITRQGRGTFVASLSSRDDSSNGG